MIADARQPPVPRGEPMLRLVGITKHFPGVVANRDVSLEVFAGEIHALLGENGAGKTTLMNVASGLLSPDRGEIHFRGRRVLLRSPLDAKRLGIGMVHQHFMLVPRMTVAENIALGERPHRLPIAELTKVGARLREVSRQYGLAVEPSARVADLSVGERQRVEIVRLLARGADLLIFDEPTGVLTPQEWQELAAVVRRLADEGKAIILITHKLEELLGVSHRCTVMRDGSVVGTVATAETDKSSLARMMVGREVVLRIERPAARRGSPVLAVEDLTLLAPEGRSLLQGITFDLHEGEVLGVAGVDGNGQQELVEVLTGLVAPTSGTISVGGTRLSGFSPKAFKRLGGGVIHADRHRNGIALDLTLQDNLMMGDVALPRFSRRGWLREDEIRRHCWRLLREYDIRVASPAVLMRQLSGGNQQKAVLARELDRRPKLLVAAQPTRGLDVGAVEFVYQRLIEHTQRGGATLLISTELDEVLSLADRIAVIVGGRFLAILEAKEATAEALGLLMGGEAEAVA